MTVLIWILSCLVALNLSFAAMMGAACAGSATTASHRRTRAPNLEQWMQSCAEVKRAGGQDVSLCKVINIVQTEGLEPPEGGLVITHETRESDHNEN